MPIKQLVYVSEEAVAFDKASLTSLLDRARQKNTKTRVTGVLLHSPGLFAQCIEGETAMIDSLYAKILADPRHSNIVQLHQLRLDKRCFSEWSMGCASVSASEMLELKTAEWQKVIESHRDRPWISPGFVLMEALWSMHQSRRF